MAYHRDKNDNGFPANTLNNAYDKSSKIFVNGKSRNGCE